jgi:hypothetical protein
MARDNFFIALALVLGAASTEVADDWSARSSVAHLWFFSLAPAVLDFVSPSLAWLAASLVYAAQYLAVYGAADAALQVLARVVGNGVAHPTKSS